MADASRPKVLILLATYNGVPWISLQLKTIFSQINVDVRVVVSDDGSSDGTVAEIEQFSPRVKVLSPLAPSGSAAQNFFRLIRSTPAGDCTHIALADQDDLWHEKKLIQACTVLASSRAAGYSCAVTAFWPDGAEKVLAQSEKATDADFLFEGGGQGCTYVLDAGFYTRIRQFLLENEQLTTLIRYHDWAIYAIARCWQAGWVFDGKPYVRYRQHRLNDTGAKSSYRGILKRVLLIWNGWYGEQIRTMTSLCQTAGPANQCVARWKGLLVQRNGVVRIGKMVAFCWSSGRRRRTDNLVLMLAVLMCRI